MARVGCCRPGLHIPSPLGEAWSVRAKVTSSRQTFPQPLSHTLAAQGLLCWLPPEHLAHLVTPVSLLALTNDRADPRSTATPRSLDGRPHWQAALTCQSRPSGLVQGLLLPPPPCGKEEKARKDLTPSALRSCSPTSFRP